MNSEENFITIDMIPFEKEGVENFFFDTYAFYEIIKKNKNYLKYKNCGVITTKLNLFELYHGLLKDNKGDIAEVSLSAYYPYTIDFDQEVIVVAAKLKHALNKRDVSMTDCIGYVLAKQLGIKFLTGDSAFEHMENVEFVY